MPEAGFPLELVPPVPLAASPGQGPRPGAGEARARRPRATADVFDRVRPDVVVGFGGYVSVPAYLVARRRHVPIVVHEGNAIPGIANKLGARFTEHVATSFPNTDLPHATYVGLPIRRQISGLDRAAVRDEAREYFGLEPDRPTLLVTGGSQGARRINLAMAAAAHDLADAGVQVLHAAGRPEEVVVESRPGDPPYVVETFIDRIDLAYAAADLIVCRAGANTVTEVAAVGLPAAFVPLPIGNGEQAHNAHPVVRAGGALLIDDEALDAHLDRPRARAPRHRSRAARRHVQCRLRPGAPRRRRAARRHGHELPLDEDPDPRRHPPGRPARTRALHRHRRRRRCPRSPGS